MTDPERVTYRSVLANREYAAILLSQTLSILGDQIARIALAFLVYGETGSAFAASATYGVSFLSYMVAGPMLSTLADRFPRRGIMVQADIWRALVVVVLSISDLPIPAVFALIVLLGCLAPAFDAARSATLPELLPGDAYVKGNALYNLVFQGTQVAGFLAGGALLTAFSVSQVLLFDAGTFLVSAGILLGALLARPVSPQARDSQGLLKDTAEGVRVVTRNPTLRRLLAFALLGVAVVAAPEALAIPVAAELGGDSLSGGILTAAVPAGFVLGTFFVLRVAPERRVRLLGPLTALSALPLLATPAMPSVPAVTALWVLAGTGAALQVIASAAYVTSTPEHARARAYGLASTSLMAAQGAAQLLGGSLASLLGTERGARGAVAVLAAAVLLLLIPLMRPERDASGVSGKIAAQGISEIVR